MERKNIIQAIIACAVGLLIYAICVSISLFGFAHEYAQCDDGYSIWRENPGAFSSFLTKLDRV